MDEASSRFVDQIALERLLGEKLQRVKHLPTADLRELEEAPFAKLVWSEEPPDVRPGIAPGSLLLRSDCPAQSKDEDWYSVFQYEVPNPKGSILLIHGLYEDNRAIYGFLISELNRLSYSVHLTTLPFHYERTPSECEFSGEYFFSANLARTKAAFCQACVELHQCHTWLSSRSAVPVFVVGFSMGGTVALTVAALANSLRGLTVINPAARLGDVIWTSPLCKSIKRDLSDAGYSEDAVRRAIASFDPYLLVEPLTDRNRIQMIYALYDQITLEWQYESLISQWRIPNVHRYKAGHLNTLRVPRLAEDIVGFCERVGTPALCSNERR